MEVQDGSKLRNGNSHRSPAPEVLDSERPDRALRARSRGVAHDRVLPVRVRWVSCRSSSAVTSGRRYPDELEPKTPPSETRRTTHARRGRAVITPDEASARTGPRAPIITAKTQRALRLPVRAVTIGRIGKLQSARTTAARRALITVFAVRSAVGRPPRERAKLRANAGRRQATPSDARRLTGLVKCPLSDTRRRPATDGT